MIKVEFLGTGGAISTPRPACTCRVCLEAREKGIPYSRGGPAVFIHGPNVLIDTPEEIKEQLNRSQLPPIAGCFYSHWHPDHTMGRRIWEMNLDWQHWPPQNRQTTIYLPQQVAADFRQRLGTWEHFRHFEELGIVTVQIIADGQSVMVNGTRITPFRLAQDFVYGFLFEQGGKRLVVVMDEHKGWVPAGAIQNVDLLIMPMGIIEFDLWNGERRIPAGHPILQTEAHFAETVEIVRQANPGRVILTHIEEAEQLSYDDLCRLESELANQALPIQFAYDGLTITL